MARGLKPREMRNQPVSIRKVAMLPDSVNKPRREMRLSLGQIIVMWSVIAGAMVMVFLFGLYAGREQGLRSALDEHGTEAVRLPVANPIAVSPKADNAESGSAVGNDAGSNAAGGNEAGGPEALSATGELKGGEAEISSSIQSLGNEKAGASPATAEPEVDFSPSTGTLGNLGQPENPKGDGKGAKKDNSGEKASIEIFRNDSAAAHEGDVKSKAAAAAKAKAAQKAEEHAASESAKNGSEARLAKPVSGGTRAADSITPTSKISSGWYVQAAASRTGSEAAAMARKLQTGGLKVKVEEAKVGKATYYRVVVGPYASKDSAVAGSRAVKNARVAQGEPFLKHIE